MKRSRFTEEQVIGILKEHQAGLSASELCRRHGISDATFYNWRSKYGGMDVSDAKKLKALEAENAKLKKLLAESVMDVSTLKDMLGKNFWRPVRRETPWTGRSQTKTTRSAGRVPWSVWTGRRIAMRRVGLPTRRSANACGSWRRSVVASAIAGCIFCCGARG